MVPIKRAWVLHITALRSPTSHLSPFSRYFESKILTLTFDPSGSSKVKIEGAKLGAGLQQASLRRPAKFRPDHANGLRDVCYQIFHFLILAANRWARVHQRGDDLLPTQVYRPAIFRHLASTHAGDIPYKKSCRQSYKVRNSKRYIPSIPIGMW